MVTTLMQTEKMRLMVELLLNSVGDVAMKVRGEVDVNTYWYLDKVEEQGSVSRVPFLF